MEQADTLLLGQTIGFDADPFTAPPEEALRWHRRGAVLIRDGRIIGTGDADALIAAHPRASQVNCGDHILAAGFVDAHNHYPQTRIIASWGSG